MINKKLFITSLFALSMGVSYVHAEETASEKSADSARDMKRKTKKGVHKMEDKGCEMVNGKMECAGKKMKHKANEAVDATKDEAKELKNKAD